jgi:hypothetical protein
MLGPQPHDLRLSDPHCPAAAGGPPPGTPRVGYQLIGFRLLRFSRHGQRRSDLNGLRRGLTR